MSWTQRNLRQKITLWVVSSKDVYGKPTYTSSIIKGRWEDKQQNTVDSEGNDLVSNATVFVGIDIATGSYLYNGVSEETSPAAGSREVKNFSKIPNIRGNIYERKAILK